jgi:phosphoribosyl-ATP pyrophosphohydrolase
VCGFSGTRDYFNGAGVDGHVTVQGADEGDTTMIQKTLPEAAEQFEAVAAVTDNAVAVIEEVVADKAYHSRTPVHDLGTLEIHC